MKEITIENIEARLKELTILELRQTARAVGVERPATDKKEDVVNKILAIAKGEVTPIPVPENHTLTQSADKKLVKDIQSYRESIVG